MPSVNAPSPYPSAGGFVPPDTGRTLDRDAFLQLLVTQLSNQDPLNPQDGHEFAAQLAQFSSVEQLTSIGETLAGQTQLLAGLSQGLNASSIRQEELSALLTQRADLASATGLIGQTIEAEGNHTVWNGTDRAPMGFELGGPSAHTTVTVRDENGRAVRTMELGHLGQGRHAPSWDGTGDDGRTLPPGTYTFDVIATDTDGDTVEATPFTQGRVDRITIEADGITLWIGTHGVPLADLRSLTE